MSRSNDNPGVLFAFLVPLLVMGTAIAMNFPELRRYIRIERM